MPLLHPGADCLRAFADGELVGAARERAARHMAGCAPCRARAAAFRARREEIRRATALEPPAGAWEAILARRGAGEEMLLPLGGGSGPRTGRPAWGGVPLRRAAVFLLAAAGAASATVPGSPVRGWLAALAPRTEAPSAGANPTAGTAAAAPASSAAAPAVVAGVGVLPDGGRVRVEVERPSPELRIRVRLADQPRAGVRGMGAAAGAAFGSGRGRITVSGAEGGELEVVLPRSALRAELVVDGRRYLTLDNGRLTLLAPGDTAGAEVVFPARP